MLVLGLTGSIGMGKSTTAAMFSARGVPVHDSDAAVHRLYSGKAVPLIGAAFPAANVSGAVDRRVLAKLVVGNPAALGRLEAIVHPLVREGEAEFLRRCRADGARVAVVDVPLLLESPGADRVDAILVVTASESVQRTRVLARPGMDPEKFESLLARQMPDAEKRRRAHFVLDTGRGLAAARRGVDAILRALAAAA